MKPNSNGSNSKLAESRSKPFDIDLNETPLSSPRETVVTGAPADVTPERHSSQRIRAGGAAVGLLDINALPPVEEETCEFNYTGGPSVSDTSLIWNSSNGLATHLSLLHGGNKLDLLKASGSVASLVKSSYEDIMQQRLNFGGNWRENPNSIVRDSLLACDTLIHRAAYQKECALDGNSSDSIFDVARHLGLVSKYHSVESQGRRDGSVLMQKGWYLSQRRKDSLMFSQVKNSRECQENLKSSFGAEYPSRIEAAENQACKLKSHLSVALANVKENGVSDSLQAKVGLPVQFEDFCILALGEVDPRPSYHSNSQIWPVGYRSSWHDKITGSLFVCDVSDGGDFGPLFKVKRYPCSTQPIPVGSTVLLRPSYDQQDGKGQVETDDTVSMHDDDDDYTNIQLIFSNDSPPHLDYDVLSDLGKSIDETHSSQPMNNSETKSNCLSQSIGRSTTNYKEMVDDIGEFLVEGRSSSSVWRMVSQTLAHACRKVYEQTGVCRFCCRHDVIRMWSSCFASQSEESAECFDSLTKFCCLSGPINVLQNIRSNDELDTSCGALIKWLDHDRFGLDAEFVQEIIEQLPQVHICAEYIFLNKRRDRLTLKTVGSGFLQVKRKSDIHEREADSNLFRCLKRPREQINRNPTMKSCFPPGKPLSSKLPTELIGDVLQSWELLWRFSEVLGLEESLSFKELEEELMNGYSLTLRSSSTSTLPQHDEHAFIAIETEGLKEAADVKQASNTDSGCTGVALADVLCSLLKILLGELQSKAATFVDSNFDGGESKSRRRRKKDADNLISAKKIMLDLLPINGLTWPELARRYVLAVSSMEGNLDSVDFVNRESCKAFHCLQGDSGTIHGTLPGVAGMEAEALLLAEATKQIFGSLKNTNDISVVDYIDFNASSSSENIKVNDDGIPEWAQVLEPVRKLPTNVGARIRKRVYDALDKGPPEWARKRLEHSISKEVYKGNASGPTKKAVLSVLTDVCGESQHQKPNRKRRNRCFSSASDVIMKQCQKVLRCAAAADEEKVFCNLLGRTLLNTSDNDDEGLLGFPAMVSRPLDFRTIDLRLSVGAYSGSHEAFLEDVREVWHHIRTAYSDQSDLLELAENLSQNFEVLYEKEVLTLAQKFRDCPNMECLNSEAKKEIEDILESDSEMPKAPWDEGVCKVCGIDKDDDNVLLCDTCDSGYHTYCLSPPLARVPEGNWYCPPCATGNCNSQYTSQVPQVISPSQKQRYQGEFTCRFLESLSHLSTTMETRDYWEYSAKERIYLLKFLCDELLNSVNIREHLERCTSVSTDLQQKLRSLSLEWRNLKFKEETLIGKVARVNTSDVSATEKSEAERVSTLQTNYGTLMRQPPSRSSYFSSLPTEPVPDDGWKMYGAKNVWKQPCWSYSKGTSVRKPICSGNQFGKAPCTGLHVQQQLDNSLRIDNPQNELPIPASQPQTHDSTIKDACWSNFYRGLERQEGDYDSPTLPNSESPVGNISSDTIRNHVADQIHTMPMISENQFLDHHSIAEHDMNELQAHDLKVNLLKKEIAVLQDSIACLESELQAVSLRKELLGKDSAGRLYWAFSRPSTSPWLLVEGRTMLQQRSLVRGQGISLADNSVVRYSSPYGMENSGMPSSSSWFSYQSSDKIEELIEWLEDSDPRDREVADSILQWHKIGNKDSDKAGNCVQDENIPSSLKGIGSEATVNSNGLVTKALIVLEKKHGPCLEVETSKISMRQDQNAELIHKERMYRCDCLEPVWPSRFHCCCCHLSFSSRYDFEEHNDRMCNPGASSCQKKADDDATRGKRLTRTQTSHTQNMKDVVNGVSGNVKHEIGFGLFEFPKELACPYDIEEISAKFVTKNSIKELVQEIGLIGLDGVPSFVPSKSPYLSDPSLKLVRLCRNEVTKGDISIRVDDPHFSVPGNMKSSMKHGSNFKNSTTRIVSGNDEELLKSRRLNPNLMNVRREESYLKYRSSKLGIAKCSIIHDCSLRPVMGRGIEILRQLKINLLDMDAAVPEEALRSSKASWKKRCAWRAFVKSSKSIFEMVQATIVFEDMIKTDYLRNGWWYWSSLSAAAKIATISALALRMYTLDAAIIYEKSSALSASTEILEHSSMPNKDISSAKDSTNNTKPSKPALKTPSSDLTDFCKLRSKSSRKRKDLGG